MLHDTVHCMPNVTLYLSEREYIDALAESSKQSTSIPQLILAAYRSGRIPDSAGNGNGVYATTGQLASLDERLEHLGGRVALLETRSPLVLGPKKIRQVKPR